MEERHGIYILIRTIHPFAIRLQEWQGVSRSDFPKNSRMVAAVQVNGTINLMDIIYVSHLLLNIRLVATRTSFWQFAPLTRPRKIETHTRRPKT